MLNLTSEEIEQYKEDGWLDSPATLDIPEEAMQGMDAEELEAATPDQIIEKVEAMGFIVMSPEQLKAEANKMASTVLDIGKFEDEVIFAEFNKRTGTKPALVPDLKKSPDALINRFLADHSDLTDDELVELGSEYKLGLRLNFSREVMCSKIHEAIELSKNAEG